MNVSKTIVKTMGQIDNVIYLTKTTEWNKTDTFLYLEFLQQYAENHHWKTKEQI
jgi:hypothetical protein